MSFELDRVAKADTVLKEAMAARSDAVVAALLSGHSIRECADAMGTSISPVLTIMSNARLRFNRGYQREGDDDESARKME